MLTGRVDVHANLVHAAHHDGIQGLLEATLVHVVLILAHSKRLGVYLDELRQRVHQSPTYGDSPADRHVFVRELLAGRRRG